MRRRKFITLIGAAAAWPLAARSQQAALPMIGFLNGGPPAEYAPMVAAFREGLKELGHVEVQNVAIEFRWAEGKYERLSALGTDLVRRQVAAIAGTSTPAAQAAKALTGTGSLVFTTGADPVQLGLVASLNQQGGTRT